MLYVSKRMTFSSSHRLFNPEFSDEKNVAVFDKCNNPNGHGHNYTIEVTVAGRPNPETGYVIDLKKLKMIIGKEIISKVDHKHLNHDVDFLSGIIPTAENLTVVFWRILSAAITEGELYRIKLYENENSFVEYHGEKTEITVFK